MNRTATHSASTFAALLGVFMHALMLLSTGLAAGAASAGEGDRTGGSVFWSLCVNGQLVTPAGAASGEDGQPAGPAHGVPACPLCAPSAGFALVPPELPSMQPSTLHMGAIGPVALADPHAWRTAARPPARAPPRIS